MTNIFRRNFDIFPVFGPNSFDWKPDFFFKTLNFLLTEQFLVRHFSRQTFSEFLKAIGKKVTNSSWFQVKVSSRIHRFGCLEMFQNEAYFIRLLFGVGDGVVIVVAAENIELLEPVFAAQWSEPLTSIRMIQARFHWEWKRQKQHNDCYVLPSSI